MTHLSGSLIIRFVLGEIGEVEEWSVTTHLLSCEDCRACVADSFAQSSSADRWQLKPLARLLESESQSFRATLLAEVEWSELKRLPKAEQKKQVVLRRICHTPEFLAILLRILRRPSSRAEAESVAALASLAIQGLDTGRWSPAYKGDLMAEFLIELANSRRLATEWDAAGAALQRAASQLSPGSVLHARRLSVTASLLGDQGRRSEAHVTLEQSLEIYEAERDWIQVARGLVTKVNLLVDVDPEGGLKIANRALNLIPPNDPILLWHGLIARTECLLGSGLPHQALRTFKRTEELRRFQPQPRADIRTRFTSARLLEVLGLQSEAQVILEEVVTADLEASLLKDAFLDLLYLFASHVKAGSPDRAAAFGRQTLAQLDLMESVHDQLKDVWTSVITAAERGSLDLQAVPVLRDYLRACWRRPGSAPALP